MIAKLKTDEQLKFFQVLANEATMGLLAFDIKTRRCVYANKLTQDMLELPIDYDLENFELEMLYCKRDLDPKLNKLNEDIIQHEGLFQNIVTRKINGQSFIANLGLKKVEVEEKNLLLFMLQDISIQYKLQRDITEKQNAIKQAFEDLLLQNKQLKNLDIAKNRFIAITTHELRTPLSAVVASAEILKLGLYDDEEQLKEFIDMIYEQGNHLLELVNDILDFAKIQANKMDFYIEEHNVFKLLKRQVEGLESMAESTQVKMTLKESSETASCYYDEIRLKQVINNILNNAIKYNRPHGTVNIWTETKPEHITIYVEDSGRGISPEHLKGVFNEFETLGKVAQHSKGTGLGMPISKRLIEGMGGSIHLTSEIDKGTTFWIHIPRKKVLDEENYRTRPDENEDLAA